MVVSAVVVSVEDGVEMRLCAASVSWGCGWMAGVRWVWCDGRLIVILLGVDCFGDDMLCLRAAVVKFRCHSSIESCGGAAVSLAFYRASGW